MEAKYTLLYTWQIKEKPLKERILKVYKIVNKLKNIMNTIFFFYYFFFTKHNI